MGELLQQLVVEALARGPADGLQQRADLRLGRQGQIQQGDALLQFQGHLPAGGGDHQGEGAFPQAEGKVAQFAADAGVFAVAVEIIQHQDRRLVRGQAGQAVEGTEGIAGSLSLAVGQAGEALDEIPAQQGAIAEAPCRLLQQRGDALLLLAADPDDGRAGADQQVEMVGPGPGHGAGSDGVAPAWRADPAGGPGRPSGDHPRGWAGRMVCVGRLTGTGV